MRQKFGDELFDRWLAELTLVSASEDEIGLGVPNHWVRDWIRSRYLDQMTEVVRGVAGEKVKLSLHIDPRLFQQRRRDQQKVFPSPAPPGESPVTLDGSGRSSSEATGAKPPSGFDHFLANWTVGCCNQLASSAALQVLESPGEMFNPLLVFGPTGVGKTHLLKGLYHAFRAGGRCASADRQARGLSPWANRLARGVKVPRNLKVRYLSGEKFFNHFAASAQDGSLRKFRDCYRSLDVLILDDIQLLASKKKTQVEFLHTFNSLIERGKQIIVSSDTAPKNLEDLGPSLVGRLLSGLVARIRKPDFETRLRIVKRRGRRLKSRLDPKVLKFLAEGVRGSVRELIGALMQLDVHASLRKEDLDVEATQEILAEIFHEQQSRITLRRIHEVVAYHFGLSLEALVSSNRQRCVSLARQTAMYLSRRYTRSSLAEIGKYYGKRKHTTVKCAVAKISALLQTTDSTVAHDLAVIIDSLEGS